MQQQLEGVRLRAALTMASAALFEQAEAQGHWSGELSSSALSTATAVVALSTAGVGRERVTAGLRWLAQYVNADGGWGDTVVSKSNISTTALCWAAFGAAGADSAYPQTVTRAAARLAQWCGCEGNPRPAVLVEAIKDRYGKDRTFSVPILMTLALAGRLGKDGWRWVPALPFELAALPQRLFGALRLPVVSYALPALIAIGVTVHYHAPSVNPIARLARILTRRRTLKVLARIQPANGGFLEATPLTSFVTMSLASAGLCDHPVVTLGTGFLCRSARADGSWAIDTNLSTWVTSLSVKALAYQPRWAAPEVRAALRQWFIGQQYRSVHPYTLAAPGGWAWTDLPGGVPDADDTAGALIALLKLGAVDGQTRASGIAAVGWLLGLQNSDGGIPTFCRGWGTLPFDRSSPDITAHTLRAWSAWLPQLPLKMRARVLRAIERGLRFLARAQNADGSWLPLWFGNEHAADDENFTYGTAHVLLALRELRGRGFHFAPKIERDAIDWLLAAQDPSGAWSGLRGGPPSVEETALAVEALAGCRADATSAGALWLVERIEQGTWTTPAPIGFYFAKLWYYERLYPLIFTVAALGRTAGLRDLSEPPEV